MNAFTCEVGIPEKLFSCCVLVQILYLQTGMEPPKFEQISKVTSFLPRGFAGSMISWGIHDFFSHLQLRSSVA